jgi:hypothetical protein
MLLTTVDSSIDTPLGQILRLPCKFVKGETDTSAIIIAAIAAELKQTGRNVLPVIVQQSSEDQYKAVLNAHIIAAARQAKLDFVWCIVVNDSMEQQLQVEVGDVVRISLKAATENEITRFFEFIQIQQKSFSKIQPSLIAKAIVEYRQGKTLKDLNFLAKLKCGIGKTKLPLLKPYMLLD